MSRSIILFTCIITVFVVHAQTPEEITRRVAANVIQNTSFAFTSKQTGETVNTLKNSIGPAAFTVKSDYNEWYYFNGVLNIAMLQLGELLAEKQYTDYALRSYDFIFSNVNYLQQHYKKDAYPFAFHQYFRLGKLDDCGAMGAGLADVNRIAKKQEYSNYLDRAARYISTRQQRLPDGTFVRPEPRPMTLWADDLYMSVPFLARMGKITGKQHYFIDAIRQVENFTRYLYNPAAGLFYHCWYSDVQMNGVAHWGRCNGWVMLAQVELLNHLPVTHPKRKQLIALLQRQIIGISRYQDATGLWRQVLDKADSYLETSCTAMFVYSIARAVNAGWIDKTYLTIAQNGWRGLAAKIRPDGQVEDICIGTGIEDNLQFYYQRPVLLNDIHGIGAVLLAGIEIIKSNNTTQ